MENSVFMFLLTVLVIILAFLNHSSMLKFNNRLFEYFDTRIDKMEQGYFTATNNLLGSMVPPHQEPEEEPYDDSRRNDAIEAAIEEGRM